MAHQVDNTKLSAAPQGTDIELVSNYFNDKCNCYSYAVQDYLAGHLSNQDNDDFHYLPRPGQTRGRTYSDLMGDNIEGMRRAIHEDGLNFAGASYPKNIPAGHYVICCFLEPKEYHFIRQNRDGSWSSKDGRGIPTTNDAFGEPLTNPENYYHGDKNYRFVGYFFVPEGGIQVGIKGHEIQKLNALNKHTKNPKEKQEQELLQHLTAVTEQGNQVVKQMRTLLNKKGLNTFLEMGKVWEDYLLSFDRVSRLCKAAGYTRRNLLVSSYTHPKNNPHKKGYQR